MGKNGSADWIRLSKKTFDKQPQLILVIGAIMRFEEGNIYEEVRKLYDEGEVVMCSTSGEIQGNRVLDNSIQISALCFNSTTVKTQCISLEESKDSYSAGYDVVKDFSQDHLNNLLIFSDGHSVNGSDLVDGIRSSVSEDILVSGGLAGGGTSFANTLVGLNAEPIEGLVVAIGFYGEDLQIGHGCRGGWDSFGPERLVTKSKKNILYELDGQNALDLYKNYLGEESKKLPGSALLFPLKMHILNSDDSVVRTILSVDENEKSMTFAGNIPMGSRVRLMQANFDKLVDGALYAAVASLDQMENDPQFAILISCVGRKLVLGPRIDEETEAIAEQFPDTTILTGFYSNGEISPVMNTMNCGLHNQTMTITTFFESVDDAQTS